MADKDQVPQAEDVVPDEPDKKRRFPIKTVVALVVIVLLLMPAFSMLQAGYYSRYPELKTRMNNWRASTHGRIACSECHVDPGPVGMLSFVGKTIPQFYSQVLQGPEPQNVLKVPDGQACQRCHTSYRQVSPAGDLLIPHKAHVEVLKINCAVCHKNLVHSLSVEGFNKPEMSTCLDLCHNGVKATNQCKKCHTQKQVPENHLAKNWLEIHNTMTDKQNCGECHGWSPDYCKRCHVNRPKSHVGNWKKDHKIRANARGTKGCLFCHGDAFCKKCHDWPIQTTSATSSPSS